MERRKACSSKGSTADDDELALVKAAAWAWFERGSGSETRAIQESDHLSSAMPRRRRDPNPKPTRYKLEAMKMKQSSSQENPTKLTPSLSSMSSNGDSELSVSNSLLDDYEIERISKQLDLYIESSRDEYVRSTVLGSDHRGTRRSSNKVASLPENGTSDGRSKPRKKKRSSSRGFWPFEFAATCGSRGEDVVDGRRSRVTWPRQLPEKDVTAGKRSVLLSRQLAR